MSDKYKLEYALFEIWGAIQVADTIWDAREVAKRALERCGILQENNDSEEESIHE